MPEKPASFYTGKGYLKKGIFEHYKPLYQAIADLLPPPDKCPPIIDLGCGIGFFAKILYEKGYRKYTGVDFSDEILNHARKATPQYNYKSLNLYSPEAKTIFLKYKLFTAIETLEHIERDVGVLKKIPKGSTIIGSVPDKMSVGHVRIFKGIFDVAKRYHSIIDFDIIKTLIMSSKNRKVTIFRGIIK